MLIDPLRKCLRMIPPQLRWRWFMSAPLNLVAAMLESANAAAIYLLVKVVSDPAQAAGLPFAAALSRLLPGANLVLMFTGLLAAFYLFKILFTLWATYVARRALSEANIRLATTFLRAYVTAPYSFHFDRNSADITNQVNHVLSEMIGMTVSSYTQLLLELLVAGGLLVAMLVAAPLVTSTLILLTGAGLFVLLRWTDRRIVRSGAEAHEISNIQERIVLQGLGALKEIKVLGRERYILQTYESVVARAQLALLRRSLLESLPRIVTESVFATGGLFAIALYILTGNRNADLVPLLGLYAYGAFRLIPSANRMSLAFSEIRWRKVAVDRIYADYCALNLRPDAVIDHEAETPPSLSGTQRQAVACASDGAGFRFADRITFEGVGFRYRDSLPFALADLSFSIHRGESCAIVGSTGAGKSTLVDLLIGLLQPTLGRITVDGHPIEELGTAWRRCLGYVPQAIYLADDTVRRNVAFAIADDQIDDRRVWSALSMAQLDGFVRDLPAQLDATVGERGTRLSGGQRQRIAIARALYHDPEVLLFDEATSALDTATEAEVTRAIESLHGSKTMVFIAHRLSTVQKCERLLFLVDGRVQAIGSYEQLLRDQPQFRKMALARE